MSLLTWQRDPNVHAVQLAHEMGHLWARDLGRFYFVSTGVILVALEVLPLAVRNGHQDFLLLLVAVAATLLSLRSFLRAREIGADFLAAQLLGSKARDVLPNTDLAEGGVLRLLRAHPTPTQRRRAFDEPGILFDDIRVPLFCLGYTSALAVDFLSAACQVILADGRTVALQFALIPMTLITSVLVGQLLASAAYLVPSKVLKGWLRAFLFGALICMILLTDSAASASTLAYFAAVLVTARLLESLVGFVLLLVGDVERIHRWRHRIGQSVGPSLAWLGLIEGFYFFHIRS